MPLPGRPQWDRSPRPPAAVVGPDRARLASRRRLSGIRRMSIGDKAGWAGIRRAVVGDSDSNSLRLLSSPCLRSKEKQKKADRAERVERSETSEAGQPQNERSEETMYS